MSTKIRSRMLTLQVIKRSKMAFLPMLAATIISSCFPLFPAAAALAVARVMGFVQRNKSSCVTFRVTTLSTDSYA